MQAGPINDEVVRIVADLTNLEIDRDRYRRDRKYAAKLEDTIYALIRGLRQHLGESHLSELVPDIQGDAVRDLAFVRQTVIPRLRQLKAKGVAEGDPADSFWQYVHPEVRKAAQESYDAGKYTDAAQAALEVLNRRVQRLYRDERGEQKDGRQLMQSALYPANPVIRLADVSDEAGRTIQRGYMEMFSGIMMALRNPLARRRLSIDRQAAVHLLFIASFLLHKLDTAST